VSDDAVEGERQGGRIIAASWAGTALLLVVSALAIVVESVDLVATFVDLLLFVGGVVAFLWAYGIAVGRSRDVEIGIGGLYFLQGTAPRPTQLRLLGSLAAEVVIAFAAAGIRPFTSLAFSILAPMWALGLAGLWGARYGRFGPRLPPERRRRATTDSTDETERA
jgi:hypothetical protein